MFFDATQHDPSIGFEPLPPGRYTVMIVDTEQFNDSAANDQGQQNQGLKITFKVLEGEHKDRQIIERTVLNGDPTRTQIGTGLLSAICHAVGVFNLQNHGDPKAQGSELRNRHLMLDLTLTPDKKDPTKPGYNNIRSIYDMAGNKPGRTGGMGASNQQPVASAAPTAPSAPAAPTAPQPAPQQYQQPAQQPQQYQPQPQPQPSPQPAQPAQPQPTPQPAPLDQAGQQQQPAPAPHNPWGTGQPG